MSCGKKAAAQIVLLMAGAAMLCFGVWRGEAATVLSKAIKLCLECEMCIRDRRKGDEQKIRRPRQITLKQEVL